MEEISIKREAGEELDKAIDTIKAKVDNEVELKINALIKEMDGNQSTDKSLALKLKKEDLKRSVWMNQSNSCKWVLSH